MGKWHCDHAYLDWPTYPHSDTHQVAALRRPRTEARTGDWMTQEGLTYRGPLQKPILFGRRWNLSWQVWRKALNLHKEWVARPSCARRSPEAHPP